MIVRFVLYSARSTLAADRWHRDRATEFEGIAGLERIEFVRQSEPPRAGSIMFFASHDDLRAYRDSERHEWLRASMQESWTTGDEPVVETVYRLLEV